MSSSNQRQGWFGVNLLAGLARLIYDSNPGMSVKQAKSLGSIRKVFKPSSNHPHIGNQERERNFRHAKAGTHGLKMNMHNEIVFG